MAPEVAGQFAFTGPPHQAEDIRQYFEMEADEPVVHLERVATETLPGRKLEVWDVHTKDGRWWVVTNPTNLYSQTHFPSLDYTITFHVGLMTRMSARRAGEAPDEQRERLAPVWRRWSQAAQELDLADEAEQFQAVAMRCREALLALTRSIARPEMVPAGRDAPKAGDFIGWAEIIAETIAPGGSAKELRSYLKSIARESWQLVNAVTHARNAVRFDGSIAVEATQSALSAFGATLLRHEDGAPDRCPSCASYRIASVFMPDVAVGHPYRAVCESCGWTDKKPAAPRAKRAPSRRSRATPRR
jgi:predicted Zn-ribbon and HTH transcriptional regulator